MVKKRAKRLPARVPCGDVSRCCASEPGCRHRESVHHDRRVGGRRHSDVTGGVIPPALEKASVSAEDDARGLNEETLMPESLHLFYCDI